MNLYKLEGFLTKEKRTDTIYVVAPSEDNAVQRASQFAKDVKYVNHTKLSHEWGDYFYN